MYTTIILLQKIAVLVPGHYHQHPPVLPTLVLHRPVAVSRSPKIVTILTTTRRTNLIMIKKVIV